MIFSYGLGSIRLSHVHDGYGAIDGNRVFYPASQEEWSPGLAPDRVGFMMHAYQPLLISEGARHTLVDTGFGEENPRRRGSMFESMQQVGVHPDEISRVIITHAHGDHVSGNTLAHAESFRPTFPQAEYVIQEREIAALREADDEDWRKRFQPLVERGQLRTIDGTTQISGSLTCWATPGHTIGHQSVLINCEGQQALVLGDLALFYKNMERPEWGASWAWSCEVDEESRRKVAEWAVENDAILILYHDPRNAWFRLRRADEGYRVVPLEG
ncbi:MAG: hypothetical protein A2Y73_05935 [Chloroflexi bacterium RBG_13_56_8]|nr:MAG: hypothetical protein A2Y73_05935 [Chloroflexi bacterium RBG_13_56_8]